MKIRMGFVSNSSTSSFCLYGICVDREKFIEITKQIAPELTRQIDIDAGEAVEIVGDKLNLQYSLGPYDDDMAYIGLGPEDMKDDETVAQFKESVKSRLEKYFPNENHSWMLKAWHD